VVGGGLPDPDGGGPCLLAPAVVGGGLPRGGALPDPDGGGPCLLAPAVVGGGLPHGGGPCLLAPAVVGGGLPHGGCSQFTVAMIAKRAIRIFEFIFNLLNTNINDYFT